MRTSKTVGAVSLALGLLFGLGFGLGPAMAGPVLTLSADGTGTFGNAKVPGSSAGFLDVVKTLHIENDRLITAYLATHEQALNIKAVSLVKLNNGAPDETTRLKFEEVVAVDWGQAGVGSGSERWEIASSLLTAGDWQLEVSGQRRSKYSAGYAGVIQTDNRVPEPQTLALSLLALGAMAGLAQLRKRICRPA